MFALGPALVAMGVLFHNNSFVSWGSSFQTNTTWILIAALAIVALQTLILIRGTKSTFRWQNGAFIIAMLGTFIAFIVLAVGPSTGSCQPQLGERQVRRRERAADHRQGRRAAAPHRTWAT